MSTKNYKNKKQTFRNCLLGFLALFIFVGCQTSPTITSTALPPTKTASPVPTATPTLVYQPESVSMENPGVWEFSHPFVFEDWKQWIIPDNETYKLDDEYEIESIELSYQWWGMGDPSFEYQQIKRTGDVYKLNGRVVVEEKITNLIKSLSNLHAVPQTLNSITHTDDYPIWAIEITGTDGTKILLTSDSNSSMYVPWNVIYNGDIYAQYDGSVEVALADLFSVSEGEPMAAFYPGGGEEGKLVVSTGGWPNQLNYGFNGLLPIHTAFNYWTNPETGEIIGIFDGRSSIGGFGNMVIGSIDKLERIVLQKDDGSKTNCDIETLESDDPSAKQWKFTCLVAEANTSGSYYYPIKVTFGTDKGEKITSEGSLFGYWKSASLFPRIAFPNNIEKALISYEPYQKLVKDHYAVLLSFDAQVDQIEGRLEDGMNADIVFLGQVNFEDKELPYSVTTSFGIENGNIVRFDLDSNKLQTLLSKVLSEPITKNILSHEKNSILNLYYFEDNKGVDIGFSEGSTFSGNNGTRLAACKAFPFKENIPDLNTPMQGFSFNNRWNANPQFVIMDKVVRILYIQRFIQGTEDSPFEYLLPKELDVAGLEPIGFTGYFDWGPYISMSWPAETSEEDKKLYIQMIDKLPGKKEFFDWGATIEDAALAVNEEGTLDFVDCK
jgi:hypothetical protein